MKLPIKQKYLDEIKAGRKIVDFRDAHITFESIETGEKLRVNVVDVSLMPIKDVPLPDDEKKTLFEDSTVIAFEIERRW